MPDPFDFTKTRRFVRLRTRKMLQSVELILHAQKCKELIPSSDPSTLKPLLKAVLWFWPLKV